MPTQPITHCGFSDESSWNQGRYRSVSLVTGPVNDLKAMECSLNEALNEQGIQEFKWKDLTGSRKGQAAIWMLCIVADYAAAQKCRVDTLVWDAEDARHTVQGRDDLQNLARMYYHLSRNVLRTKWPDVAVWMLLPDEHHAINWNTLEMCLDIVSRRSSRAFQAPFNAVPSTKYRNEFNVIQIKPVQSSKYRLTQLADLFAGMSTFSWKEHSSFRLWENEQSGQFTLFGEVAKSGASKISQDRFDVLQAFIKTCRKMGFLLDSKAEGLKTQAYNAHSPINFWFYQSQGDYDKAPVKDKTRARGR